MTYASDILAHAPLAYYRLGDAGSTMVDASGNGHDGTHGGGTNVSGLVAGDTDDAHSYPGSVASLVSNASWLDQQASFTVLATVKPTAVSGNQTVVARYDGYAPSGSFLSSSFILRLEGTALVAYVCAGNSPYPLYLGGLMAAGVTNDVAITYDGNVLSTYVDGVLQGTMTRAGMNDSSQPLSIGATSASSESLTGVVDEVAYFGTVLTAPELLALHTSRVTAPAPAIQARGDAQSDASAQATVQVPIRAGGDAQSEASAVASMVNAAVTDNRTGGRWRNGSGTATWAPPVYIPSEPSLGARLAALAFSSPVIDDATGRISYNAVKEEIPAHLDRILVGNKDVTRWRGVMTPLPTYSYIEPLGYGPAVLTLPQVHASFERPGEGALRFLRLGSPVIIERVDITTEEVVSRDYKGVIISHDHSGGAFSVQVGGEASGRAALRQQQVPIFFWHADLGRMAYWALYSLGIPFDPYLGPVTGITALHFGGMGLLEYIQQVCRAAFTREGNQWTVMPHDDGKYRMEQKDTTTIHGTVYLDDARAIGSLVRDLSEEPNRIFMTGVTPESLRVRFGAYPGLLFTSPPPYPFTDNRTFGAGTTDVDTDTGDGITILLNRLNILKYLDVKDLLGGYDADVTQAVKDLQKDGGLTSTGNVNPATWRVLYDLNSTGYSLYGSRIMPAAEDERVKAWNYSPSGAVISRNPEYDRSVLPVDRNIDAGTGFERSQLREWAYAELGQSSEDNYVGSITLNTGALIAGQHDPGDPFTEADVMPARDLRAGMNLWLPLFAGGITVHIGGVSVSESGEVSVDVDTRARDAMEVWEVIARNRESRVSLRRAWMNENRQSAQIKDSSGVWDEVGGILGDKVVIPGNEWVVFPVLAGQSGTIRTLHVDTNPNAEYVMAVFGKHIVPRRLRRLIGNPLTRAGSKRWENEAVRASLDRQNLLLYIAGSDEEPLGYFPKSKTKKDDADVGDAPLTGRWEDDAGFPYITTPTAVLWVAVWADRNTVIPQGRIMWPIFESGT